MQILKLTCIIGCAISFGWFTRGAIQDAMDLIHDWREPARWAALAAVCIAGVIYVFP